MTPVDQTQFGDGKGNCFPACVASILGRSIDDVPNFIETGDMDVALREWLHPQGLRAITLRFFHDPMKCDEELMDLVAMTRAYIITWPDDHLILSGYSPRPPVNGRALHHAVVGRVAGWGFETVHDPHPSRDGLRGEPFGVTWIVRAV